MSRATPMHWGRGYEAYSVQRRSYRLPPKQERRYLRKAARTGALWPAITHVDRMNGRDCEDDEST